MIPEWRELYSNMQADINRCLNLEHPEKDNAESCYWIARNYWEQMQVIIHTNKFKDDQSEITFYRDVKPFFVCHIEYYSFLSEGLMFEPPWINPPENIKIDEKTWQRLWEQSVKDYWVKEEDRGQRFYSKHQAFLNYCAGHCRERDAEYFLPCENPTGEFSQRKVHNRDTKLFTVHEEILSTWMAFKMYSDYIKQKVHELVSS